jgi:hypothetical protein
MFIISLRKDGRYQRDNQSMEFFLDRTLRILSKPSISAKINFDRFRGAFGMLY